MSSRCGKWILAGLLGVASMAGGQDARADRVGDLCDVVGVRDNQLIGYGVVSGLNGTGDDVSAPFATQSLLAFMKRMGVHIDAAQFRLRNVAAVVVTATLPPFARSGGRIDVTISSIGNAKSLEGGVLLETRLYGADQHVYAVAQGPVVVGGYGAKGASGSSVQRNITTTARVPAGALVERTVPMRMADRGVVTLSLREPDFTTAMRVSQAINAAIGEGAASPVDGGAVAVTAPARFRGRPVDLIAALQDIEVSPAQPARVVINERTGTIIAGGDVRIAPVAIAHGGLTIVIREQSEVVQPNPLAQGETAKVAESDVEAKPDAEGPTVTYLRGAASLADVAEALSALGVTPRDLASILQAMRTAGALRARVEVQ